MKGRVEERKERGEEGDRGRGRERMRERREHRGVGGGRVEEGHSEEE